MEWTIPKHESWQRGIGAARAYRRANGNLDVPQAFVADDGFRLGGWLDNRRVQRRKGELASELIAELDALGMSWNPLQENWQSGIAAARAFWEANGHLRVPRSFVAEDGFPRERWITLRRHARNRGRLTTERINALDALGMVWMPPRGAGT